MSIIYKKHEKHPDSILIRKFEGVVALDDILYSWKSLINDNLITDNIKGVINNISDCILLMNMNDFNLLLEFLKSEEQLRQIRLAVICTDPSKIVFPILGENNATDLKIKAFSTDEAAVEWVMEKV